MGDKLRSFAEEHISESRRYSMRSGVLPMAAQSGLTLADEVSLDLKNAIDEIEPWLTAQDDF